MELVYPKERTLFTIAMVLAAIFWLFIILGTLGIVLLYLAFIMIFVIFAHSGFISHLKGNGIKITPEQYPDLHQRLMDCCEKVGQQEVPEAYLLRTDFFNALATRFLRRHYIVLFTDVVDALEDQPGAINFYIGHELGHIHRNHIRWGWILAPVLWLPLLGSAYRRAEEYTCDRYGNACCETDEDAYAAMAAIVAGDTRWKTMDVSAYLKQVDDTNGFFMSFNELTGEYPWLCKRMAWVKALRANQDPELPSRSILAKLLALFIPSVPGGLGSLIVIVAIVGILAAVALPAYQDYIETAEMAAAAAQQQESAQTATQAQQAPAALELSEHANPTSLSLVLLELQGLRSQIGNHFRTNGTFPGDITEMGGPNSVELTSTGQLPYAVYTGGMIGVNVGINGEAYLVIEPVAANDQLSWYCYGQEVPTNLLPDACQQDGPFE